jgi:hypothetical protein
MDLKQAAISVSMIVFVVSSMLGMGLGLRVSDIVAPLRTGGGSPWHSWRTSSSCRSPPSHSRESCGWSSRWASACSAGPGGGAPFLPKLAQISKGNLAFAVGLMVLLMVITVGYLPIVLPLLLPGSP